MLISKNKGNSNDDQYVTYNIIDIKFRIWKYINTKEQKASACKTNK